MKRSILAMALIASASVPAVADEYYVVRGPDKRCRVVETKPVEDTIVQVGPLAFVTRAEAESQIKVLCKDETTGSVEVQRVR